MGCDGLLGVTSAGQDVSLAGCPQAGAEFWFCSLTEPGRLLPFTCEFVQQLFCMRPPLCARLLGPREIH